MSFLVTVYFALNFLHIFILSLVIFVLKICLRWYQVQIVDMQFIIIIIIISSMPYCPCG